MIGSTQIRPILVGDRLYAGVEGLVASFCAFCFRRLILWRTAFCALHAALSTRSNFALRPGDRSRRFSPSFAQRWVLITSASFS